MTQNGLCMNLQLTLWWVIELQGEGNLLVFVFSGGLTVSCNSVKAGLLPGRYHPTAAVFVWWITNRACCELNSRCLNFLTSSSRWWLQMKNFGFLVISGPVRWIKVDVEVMWLNFPPFMAGDWSQECLSQERFSLNTCWWALLSGSVFWNSAAWCSNAKNKKKN